MQTDEKEEEEHNKDKVDDDEGDSLSRDAAKAARKEPEVKKDKGQGKLTEKEGRQSGVPSGCAYASK